jgi:hypothetical protein
VAVLDRRYSYDQFTAAAADDRDRLTSDLVDELTRRVRAAADPATAGDECIEDLRALGHDLWGFDEDDDFQSWCGNWTASARAFELTVEITYRENEPRSVSVTFKRRSPSRR